jgi:hypothetical protein
MDILVIHRAYLINAITMVRVLTFIETPHFFRGGIVRQADEASFALTDQKGSAVGAG